MQAPHAPLLPPDLQQALRMALEYRKSGRPAEAAALYRQQLAVYPRQPELLGHLADLLLSQGDFPAALPLVEQARAAAPGQAQFWLMQAQCLLQLGRAKDARKLITEAIGKGLRHPLADELLRQARAGDKAKPGKPVPLNEVLRQLDTLMQAGRHAEAERLGRELQPHHAKSPHLAYLLGMAALLQGRPRDAVPLFERAVTLDAGMVPALYNLGFALDGLGRLDEAAAAYRRASVRAPQLVDAHNNLGHVLQKLGRHDEALAAFERALALRPDAEIHMNRGNALRDLERTEEAVAAYASALELKPDFAEALTNLVAVQYLLGRFEDALHTSERVIECRPDAFTGYLSKGRALHELKRYDEAVAAFEMALTLKPDDAETYKNMGVTLKKIDRYEAAIASLQRAVALRPDSDNAINLLAGALLDAGRHDDALAMYRRALALDPDGLFRLHSNMLLGLNYQAGTSPASLFAEARAYGNKAARKAKPFGRHDNLADPERRLRVGFVSGDLGQHPVGFFLQNVLESLDPEKLELFAYATAIRSDELNDRLRRSFGHWCDATNSKFIDDQTLAARIHEDGIDILIDLAGHTAKNRLPVFAWKPAPVQVTWLGYLGTTGLDAIDYVLADPWALPAGEEGQFTETPWRMPESYICFSPPDLPIAVEASPAQGKGYVTFGCFNNLNKVTDEVIAVWARLLQAVPDARLYLKTRSLGAPEVRENVLAKFASQGVDTVRLTLEGQFASQEDHFRAYHALDIALDPFPYPGITTTVEALWMGVPVLSMRGDRFISHQGETILHNLGLPQWIAGNADDYVAKAAAFAADVPMLAELRAGLRARLLASPLCDAPRFARNLEAALRGMWLKWCETGPDHAG